MRNWVLLAVTVFGLALITGATPGLTKDKSHKTRTTAAELAKKHGIEPGTLDSNGKYQLSTAEQALNCKKLRGRMQVRILQIRDYHERAKSTAVSRAMQSVATPVFGGPKFGTDPDADYRKDMAMLEAYNQRLAEKNCKTVDLKAELAAPVPPSAPVTLPPSKAKP